MSAVRTIREAQAPFVVAGCRLVWRMAAVNLAGIALTLAGGVILGIAPATTAMLRAHAEPTGTDVARIVPLMWAEWRAEFARANLAAMPPLVVGIMLLAASWHAAIPALAAVVAGLGLLALVLAGAVLLAVARCSAGLRDTLHDALLIVRDAPVRLLALTLLWPPIILGALAFPPFALWFALSVHAWAAVRLLDPVLNALDHEGATP